ncbi:MAG TPA: hypothetical protein VLI04_13530 [Nocardioidaceae bacterium]|nr:hypothetical protein [Nocardioidaceae bacterium]
MRSLLAALLLLVIAACGAEKDPDPAAEPTPTVTPTVTPAGPSDLSRLPRDLKFVEVPSVCGHPAGRLVKGELPDTPEGNGVEVAYPLKFARGPFFAGSEGVALVVRCYDGGFGTPNYLAFYDDHLQLAGSSYLADVTGEGTEYVTSLWAEGEKLFVDATSLESDVSGLLTFAWDGSAMQAVDEFVFDGWDEVTELTEAVVSGDDQRGHELATPEVYDELVATYGQADVTVEPLRCQVGDTHPGQAPSSTDDWFCFVNFMGEFEFSMGLRMAPRDGGWKAVGLGSVAG